MTTTTKHRNIMVAKRRETLERRYAKLNIVVLEATRTLDGGWVATLFRCTECGTVWSPMGDGCDEAWTTCPRKLNHEHV